MKDPDSLSKPGKDQGSGANANATSAQINTEKIVPD